VAQSFCLYCTVSRLTAGGVYDRVCMIVRQAMCFDFHACITVSSSCYSLVDGLCVYSHLLKLILLWNEQDLDPRIEQYLLQ